MSTKGIHEWHYIGERTYAMDLPGGAALVRYVATAGGAVSTPMTLVPGVFVAHRINSDDDTEVGLIGIPYKEIARDGGGWRPVSEALGDSEPAATSSEAKAAYHAFLDGWADGVRRDTLDEVILSRAHGDPLRCQYENGHEAGCRARGKAARSATELTGYRPEPAEQGE